MEPKVIFDVRANVGQTVLEFARHFKNVAIYRFEPVLNIYEELVANTSKLNVKCFCMALGDEVGEATIYKFEECNTIASIKGGGGDLDLPIKKLLQLPQV